MTARSSSYSLALALLAGCYEHPDLEIAVTRPQGSMDNVHIAVCRVDDPDRCKGNAVFPTDSKASTRTVFVFVDADLAQVWIEIDALNNRFCAKVALTGETLQRTLTLDMVDPMPIWSNESFEPCP